MNEAASGTVAAELSRTELAARLTQVVVTHDGDRFLLGRPDLAVYVAVPEPGAVFVRSLQAGAPVEAATAAATEAAGAAVDGEEFLSGLVAAGILAPLGDPAGAGGRGRPVRWVEGISPRAARRLFSPVAWSGYLAATVFVVVTWLVRPDLWPSVTHVWWLPNPALSLLSMVAVWTVTAALHEMWHWLAGRAVGVPAVFRVSYRGIFLVFETDLTQLVSVPRRRRYAVFLAGMAFDVTVLAVALGLRLAHRTDVLVLPAWLDRLLAVVVLLQLFAIGWQWAALFLRSDGYAILANALRCHDLYRATWLTTKDRLWRLTEAETHDYAGISAHDRRVARVFGLGYLAGLVLMVWMLVTFAVPFVVGMLGWVWHNLTSPALRSADFWEALAVTVVLLGQYLLIAVLALRERRLRRTGSLR